MLKIVFASLFSSVFKSSKFIEILEFSLLITKNLFIFFKKSFLVKIFQIFFSAFNKFNFLSISHKILEFVSLSFIFNKAFSIHFLASKSVKFFLFQKYHFLTSKIHSSINHIISL